MKNSPLFWKSDIHFKCPKCGHDDDYIVYLNIEEISCYNCGKSHKVQLYASNVELKVC